MAHDPDSIDLDHPERSGIGRAPREADVSIRTLCHSSLLASERLGVPQLDWASPSWVAWFLRQKPVADVRAIAAEIVRSCDAIITQESASPVEAGPVAATEPSPTLPGSAPATTSAATAPASEGDHTRRTR